MILFWRIRYFDRNSRQFADRDLVLDTESLDAPIRAAVEIVVESKSHRTERDILKFRHHFQEGSIEGHTKPTKPGWKFSTVFLSNYFEDEAENEITLDEIGRLSTGDPNTRLIPSGAKEHDIELLIAEPKPIPIAEINLNVDEIKALGYFTRDLKELIESALMKDGPGSLKSAGGKEPVLETAITDDEIRSFVTIFRRLYMSSESGHFLNAVAIYSKAIGDHPYGNWVKGVGKEYEKELANPVEIAPVIRLGQVAFSRKLLLDVFIYTQYAHQPDQRRQRQFAECLAQVNGRKGLFAWMFLTELWQSSLLMSSAGKVISAWFRRYCEHHQVAADVIASLRDEHPGLGSKEKEAARRERILRERSEQIATTLWEQNGRPDGGPNQFLAAAEDQLRRLIDGGPVD